MLFLLLCRILAKIKGNNTGQCLALCLQCCVLKYTLTSSHRHSRAVFSQHSSSINCLWNHSGPNIWAWAPVFTTPPWHRSTSYSIQCHEIQCVQSSGNTKCPQGRLRWYFVTNFNCQKFWLVVYFTVQHMTTPFLKTNALRALNKNSGDTFRNASSEDYEIRRSSGPAGEPAAGTRALGVWTSCPPPTQEP